MHPFKKGQHILARCVTKGRRGPRVLEREKMSDRITPDSFFSDTHAFVAPQPVRFFFFSSPSQVLVYKMYVIFLLIILPHKKTLSSRYGPRVLQEERVFRPLLVTQLFRKSEKEEKNFLPRVFEQKAETLFRIKMHQKLTCSIL